MILKDIYKKEKVTFFFYGNLRKGKRYSWILPRKKEVKLVTIKGFKIYSYGLSPKVVRADEKQTISCEMTTYTIYVWQKMFLIFLLDILEGTILRRYLRKEITYKNKKGFIYLYNWKITKELQ